MTSPPSGKHRAPTRKHVKVSTCTCTYIYIMQCITSHYSDVFTSLKHDFSTPRTGMCNPHQCSVPCFHSSLSPVHKKYGLLEQYAPSYNGHTKCTGLNPQHVFKHVSMTVGQCMCDKVNVIINTTLREW